MGIPIWLNWHQRAGIPCFQGFLGCDRRVSGCGDRGVDIRISPSGTQSVQRQFGAARIRIRWDAFLRQQRANKSNPGTWRESRHPEHWGSMIQMVLAIFFFIFASKPDRAVDFHNL
jgi:hypothetical protein